MKSNVESWLKNYRVWKNANNHICNTFLGDILLYISDLYANHVFYFFDMYSSEKHLHAISILRLLGLDSLFALHYLVLLAPL